MKQKIKKSLMLAILLLSAIGHAKEGNEGGGGGVIACQNATGNVTKSYLYDLVEYNEGAIKAGGMSYAIQIVKSNDSVESQVRAKLETIRKLNAYNYDKMLSDKVSKIRQNLSAAEKITGKRVIRGDFSTIEIPQDLCRANEIATYANAFIYQDYPLIIKRYEEYFLTLATNTDSAALEIHEIVYALLRAKDSNPQIVDQVRRAVAVLFSTLPEKQQLNVLSELLAKLVCSSEENCHGAEAIIGRELIQKIDSDDVVGLKALIEKPLIIKGESVYLNLNQSKNSIYEGDLGPRGYATLKRFGMRAMSFNNFSLLAYAILSGSVQSFAYLKSQMNVDPNNEYAYFAYGMKIGARTKQSKDAEVLSTKVLRHEVSCIAADWEARKLGIELEYNDYYMICGSLAFIAKAVIKQAEKHETQEQLNNRKLIYQMLNKTN